MKKINIDNEESILGIYWKASHCVYDCRYHIVWITKYRQKVLDVTIQKRLSELLMEVCAELNVKLLSLGLEEDHVHMYVSIPVVLAIPMIVQTLKGRTSFKLRREFDKHIRRYYWGKKALWAVGYFVATVGEVTHDTIKKYVENQGKADIESECVQFKL